jgi:hypothetical protein
VGVTESDLEGDVNESLYSRPLGGGYLFYRVIVKSMTHSHVLTLNYWNLYFRNYLTSCFETGLLTCTEDSLLEISAFLGS